MYRTLRPRSLPLILRRPPSPAATTASFYSDHRFILLRQLSSGAGAPPRREWIYPLLDVSDVISNPKSQRPSPWVDRVLQLIFSPSVSESNLHSSLNSYCSQFLLTLSPSFVSFILRSPSLFPEPSIALTFFLWSSTQRGYRHTLDTYAAVLGVLAAAGHTTSAAAVCSNLKNSTPPFDSTSADSVIRSLGRLGMVEELLWTWRVMKDSGIKATIYTYNFLMNGLVTAGFVEIAQQVFDAMLNGKVNPDVVTYNTMIKGLCGREGGAHKGVEKLREMERRGVIPDKVTFMTLIQALYNEEDYSSCLSIYMEMEEKGVEVPPHAFTLVIGVLCKEGKPLQAYSVFQSMVGRNYKASVGVYTILIGGFSRLGLMEKAVALFERMRSEGLEGDEVTYGVLVNGLCENNRLEEAVKWYGCWRGAGLGVGVVCYSSLVDGLGKAGRTEDAERVFEDMEAEGCVPDSYCYNALIDAFFRAGRVSDAVGLFERMQVVEGGCEPTVYTYTILISGLFKHHRNEEALRVWNVMMDKGVTPTAASFRALATGLCLCGKVMRACRVLDSLAPMGVLPENAFADMINVLIKAGRIREACKLADGVIDRGREVPGKMRTVFINALRKTGNASIAIKLMHSKIGIGYDRIGSVRKRVKFRTLLDK